MVARNVVAFTAARIVAAALNVLSLAVFTRLMAPPDYGLYLLIASQAYIAHAFTAHWLLSAFFAGFQEKTGQLSTFAALAGAILLVVAAAIAVGVLLSAIAASAALAFMAMLIGFTIFEACLTLARTAFWIRRASVAVVLRAVLILVFGAGGLTVAPDALTLALAFGAGNLLASAPVLAAALPYLKGVPSRSALRGFVGFGWPLILSSGLSIAGPICRPPAGRLFSRGRRAWILWSGVRSRPAMLCPDG